ncbi:MAG: MmgE/PrpD family protein [Haloarculaceae archaeon]
METSSPEAQLGDFVASLEYGDLPEGAVDTVVRAVVDTVGVTLAGTTADAGRRAATAEGVDPDAAAVGVLLGVGGAHRPEAGALRVGTASHALDYDDLSWAMDGHPSVALVPGLLALAPEADASGRDLITAYAAGFETACAVAEPVSPEHYEAGWHATATFGTFGAAAAAANLLGLDAPTTTRCLNVAASMPAGLKRNFGSMTKPLHAGLCARSGVTAARLAREGVTADPRAVTGDKGFWDLYGPEDAGDFSVGERWRLREAGIHVKAYPCCYFTHSAIAAAAELGEAVDPEAVESVSVTASQGAADALHHADPETGLEAKFSMEYTVASGLVRDRVGLETFEPEAIGHPAVQRVRERVDFAVDERMPYDSHGATVRVETADGTRERTRTDPPGTHDDPLSEERFRAKFEECAGRVLDDEETADLYETLSALSEVEDVAAVLATA